MKDAPRFRGKAVSDWIKDLEDADPDYRRAAHEALGAMGERALPFLAEAYEPSASDELRCGVVEAVARAGPKAVGAMSLLTSALSDRHGLVRAVAASTLMFIGPNARAAVPALERTLADKDVVVRMRAAQALVAIDPSLDGAAVPVLIESLRFDGLDWVRSDAAKILGGIAGRARSAIPALERATNDGSAEVRAAASEALSKIR